MQGGILGDVPRKREVVVDEAGDLGEDFLHILCLVLEVLGENREGHVPQAVGRVIMPTSLTVPAIVPVLWASGVPGGSPPRIRPSPV